MAQEPVLLCDDRNGVRTLTLNRPGRKNAINRDLWVALAGAIAKVTGVAVGAGWNLGCDLVVATPESTCSQNFSKHGLSLDLGGLWLLPQIVGLQQAKRLTLLAETIDAAEAEALNVVTWMVSAAETDAVVTDLAERVVAGPEIALAQSKALLNEGADRTLRDALANEARAQVVNFATADALEAYAALAERREPSFTGRWAVSRSEHNNA